MGSQRSLTPIRGTQASRPAVAAVADHAESRAAARLSHGLTANCLLSPRAHARSNMIEFYSVIMAYL